MIHDLPDSLQTVPGQLPYVLPQLFLLSQSQWRDGDLDRFPFLDNFLTLIISRVLSLEIGLRGFESLRGVDGWVVDGCVRLFD